MKHSIWELLGIDQAIGQNGYNMAKQHQDALKTRNLASSEALKPLGELANYHKCGYCRGRGILYYANGEDDYYEEICEVCNGQGYILTDQDLDTFESFNITKQIMGYDYPNHIANL